MQYFMFMLLEEFFDYFFDCFDWCEEAWLRFDRFDFCSMLLSGVLGTMLCLGRWLSCCRACAKA